MGATSCCHMEQAQPGDQLSSRAQSQGDSPINGHQASSGEVATISPAISSPKNSPKGKGHEALSHMKDMVTKHMNNLREFRSFLKKHFKSPAEAWDIIAVDIPEGQLLQQAVFVKKVTELGFTGNAGSLFNVINEDGKGVSLDQFKKILIAPRKGSAFMDVVQQAVAASAKGLDSGGSKEALGDGASKQERESSPKSSPRSRGRSNKRDSSPKASKRDSSPKERASSPKDERRNSRRISKGDSAEFGKLNSTVSAVRGNSKGSLASLSTTADSTPSPHGTQVTMLKRKSV